MTPERWRRIEALYDAARTRPEAGRAAFLVEACAGDEALRREVESLLAQPVSEAGPLDRPAVEARLIAEEHSRNDPSTLVGRHLGVYQIQALLGAGGMGEVYRARDTRLGRDVAIKILPRDFTTDPNRLARFEQEARVLATLNHPNIATIHGVEETAGMRALVLEFVEGQTLADRLSAGERRHTLPLAEVLTIASQMAAALEAAHDRGIVHRDLKPANIVIRADGTVKLLDFGIAKAMVTGANRDDLTAIPTLDGVDTREGWLLGTPAYMSPEQARGQDVDKRTDIWAFGCVLYEMLAGAAAFAGSTMSDTIAAIVRGEPDWDALSRDTPASLRTLLGRCLQKDPRQRLRDVGDARIEIEDALGRRNVGTNPTADSNRNDWASRHGVSRRTAIGTLAGAAAGAAAMGVFAFGRGRDVGVRDLMRFSIALPPGNLITSSFLSRVALSPDGTHIACNAVLPNQGNTERSVTSRGAVIIRSIRELDWKPLEGATPGSPFFSPDGQSVGVVGAIDGQRLRKYALNGGAPTILTGFPDSQPSGASWASNDVIYFVSSTPGGIVRVPGQGGDPVEVCAIDFARGERTHRTPHALPGGRAVLFAVATSESESYDDASIAVFSTDTGQRKVLVEGGLYPRYSPSGHVVYGRNGTLFAVPFDADRLEVTGRPFAVLEGVMMSRNTGVANYDLSAGGDLLYVPGKADGSARTLYWVDRSGHAEKLPLPQRSYLHPRISPDGRRLAIEIEGSNHDVFVYDFASGVLTNFTADGISHWPIWSPDGRRIGYRSGPMGKFKLFQMPSDRSGPPEQLQTPTTSASTESYDPTGRAIAYTDTTYGHPVKVMVASVDGSNQPQPLDDTRFAQGSPKFSPDGRWLAYCTNESGRPEVYVKRFPSGAKIQISNDGGNDPVWRRDGRELFYRNGDRMMAVPVSAGDTFEGGRPQELWRGPYSHGMSSSCGAPGLTSSNYDVTPDGSRFLMIQDEDDTTTSSNTLVLVIGFAQALQRQRA
jgi:eukaryotic-like serine/threonine-protein kinase